MPLSSIIFKLDPVANGYLNYSSARGMWFVFNPANSKCSAFAHCRDVLRRHWEGFGHNYCTYIHLPFGGTVAGGPVLPYIGLSWFGPGAMTKDKIIDFAAKWDALETRLGLTERSDIHPTNLDTCMIVRLSSFWMANDTVRSFATLFIRMLMCYPAATFEASIELYDLARSIRGAIMWFLEGHVNPTYDKMTVKRQGVDSYYGIVNEMLGLSPLQLVAKLTKPPAPVDASAGLALSS